MLKTGEGLGRASISYSKRGNWTATLDRKRLKINGKDERKRGRVRLRPISVNLFPESSSSSSSSSSSVGDRRSRMADGQRKEASGETFVCTTRKRPITRTTTTRTIGEAEDPIFKRRNRKTSNAYEAPLEPGFPRCSSPAPSPRKIRRPCRSRHQSLAILTPNPSALISGIVILLHQPRRAGATRSGDYFLAPVLIAFGISQSPRHRKKRS